MSTYSADEFRYQHICGTCFGLYEVGRPDGLDQRCACRPAAAERWPRFDFNTRAELCRCCGAEAVRSGSRWSPFFCRECQLLAMGVSIWHGDVVFPIGRHSLMNAYLAPAPRRAGAERDASSGDSLAVAMYRAATVIQRGAEQVDQWRQIVVARNLEACGLRAGVSLNEYVTTVRRTEGLSRWAAFRDLCAFVKAVSLAERPSGGCS